jgi:dephospho-CoA kinase
MAREMGYDIVVMGDVIRQETLKRGLELTPQNVGKVMLELRKESGNFVIAQKCVPEIEEQASSKVLVDGLRSLFEADIFKEHFTKFSLVAVHASPQIRFSRLSSRGRSDDPVEWKVFQERDMRELGVGLGNVIAMAEQVIVNDNSFEYVKAKVKASLERIEEKWK